MHPNSYNLMQSFRDKYLPGDLSGVRVLDVGAMDLNGCYRPIFGGAEYVGLDMEAGPNVDVVCNFERLRGRKYYDHFDVVVSGQTLEHSRHPDRIVQSIAGVVKPGGLTCCIAPWQWVEHKHPLDCWRILPDGMRVLYEDAGLEMLECYMSEWDTIGIGRKP